MPTVSITWHTILDERVCPICRQLEGYTWTLELGKGAFPTILEHPGLGIVWDINGSTAHGHEKASCRCRIEPTFNFSDILVRLQKLYDMLSRTMETKT